MASRFEIVKEEYIEKLRERKRKSENESMKNNILEHFQKVKKNERNLQANLEEYENDVPNQRLSQF